MKCKYCQSEIDARAKVCPHCRRKQSNDGLIITLSVIGVLLFLSIGIPFVKGFMSGLKSETSYTPPSASSVVPPTEQATKPATEPPTEAEAVVIYDKDDIKISYLGLEQNDRKAAFKLLIENNTADNKMIQVNDFSVNGFMIEPYFSAHVAAGKSAYDSIDILNTTLDKNKITEIKSAEFKFHFVNEDDWNIKTDSDIITLS